MNTLKIPVFTTDNIWTCYLMTRVASLLHFAHLTLDSKVTAYSSLAVREPLTSAVQSSFSKITEIQTAASQVQNVNRWFERVGEIL